MINLIFHHPLPLGACPNSASGIRPLRMLDAFRRLGVNVDVISGYSYERSEAITRIKEKIKNGFKYDLMYSECSTQPTILTDKHHLPIRPLLDSGFFYTCKKNNIPIALFYRDIYWRFGSYGNKLNLIKKLGAKMAYIYDLSVYKRTLTKLYLPSIEMGKYVPIVPESLFSALPPGHQKIARPSQISKDMGINIFYVGGMSDHYRMHILFEAMRQIPEHKLTVCTRKEEWFAVENQYQPLAQNIEIVHEAGAAMEKYLDECDIASVFVEPQEYWEFASPVKLYEYLGTRKPILATVGTLAGKFVQENAVGWSLPYTQEAIIELFASISNDRSQFLPIYANLDRIGPDHSWRARAEKVIKDLIG